MCASGRCPSTPGCGSWPGTAWSRSTAPTWAGPGAAPAARSRASSTSSPSRHALRVELQGRVQAALALLSEVDREVLVLRYLEQMPLREVAAVLGVGLSAVKMRHFRALERLRTLLEAGHEGDQP